MNCNGWQCSTPTTGAAPRLFTSALQFLMTSQCLIGEGTIPQEHITSCEKYDFIVIGAGSAGCVIANRLSEIPEWNVLLIEAGGDAPIEADIPALDKSIFQTEYDWNYTTTYNGITDEGFIGNAVHWTRGKVIGGSSNLNAMIYIQGNDQDYQNWYDEGNIHWGVDEVRRFFKKAESFQDMSFLKEPKIQQHYGKNGPLVINTFNSTYMDVTKKVLASWAEIGIPNVSDLNVANVMGSGITRATAANGERQSTNKAYLNPILNRKNLKILTRALVKKILINQSRQAYGIVVEYNEQNVTFLASKEIILSAGAINSPHLLMLSGIGAKEHLQSLNIPYVVDLPMVGQNLQDHCSVPVTIFGDESGEYSEIEENVDVVKYIFNRTGYLAQASISDILAFYSKNINATYPDFQSHLVFFRKNTPTFRRGLELMGYKKSIVDSLVRKNKYHAVYNFLFNLLHPKSMGNVSLISSNPKEAPRIYANYFMENEDLEKAVTGIIMLTKIVNTTYFRSINGYLGRIKWAPCNELALGSRDYWKCVCLSLVSTIYHPVGTCKMGSDPKTSVVDGRLRVHGASSLRVIDASIMPTITSGNTNAPSIMIGERGSELVKEDYGKA